MFFICFTQSCLAADWCWVGADSNMGLFVDMDSIRFELSPNRTISNHNRVYVWIKVEYDESYAQNYINPPNTKYFLAYDGIDLQKNEAIFLQQYHYDKNGVVIYTAPPEVKWNPIVPNTVVSVTKDVLAKYVSEHIKEIEQQTLGE